MPCRAIRPSGRRARGALSQVRITIEFKSASALRRAFGISRLNLDVVDYPGEWLIDLPLLDMSYEQWCAEAVEQAAAPRRQAHSKAWREFLSGVDPNAAKDEQVALRGANLFAAYLKAARADDHVLHTTGPGRFLLPGDLEGSPLLTFCPLALGDKPSYGRSSLAAMMARRFESYKTHVVRPFFTRPLQPSRPADRARRRARAAERGRRCRRRSAARARSHPARVPRRLVATG